MGAIGRRALLATCLALAACDAPQTRPSASRPELGRSAAALLQGFHLQQKLTLEPGQMGGELGMALAIDGASAVIGEPGFPIEPPALVGAAYAWARGDDGRWSQVQRLAPSNGTLQHGLGSATALLGDLALLGAPFGRREPVETDAGVEVAAGAVHVFKHSGDAWEERPTLLQADPNGGDYLGAVLASDGQTLMVAAPGDDENGQTTINNGAVYMLQRQDDGLVWTDKLTGEFDHVGFGYALDVSGDRALVSELELDTQQRNAVAGRIYAFERKADAWKQVQQLQASDAEPEDGFGWSISIDGDLALIGAQGRDDDEECDAYDQMWSQPCDSGGAYLFAYSAGQWVEQQRLQPDDLDVVDWFGHEVLLSGDYALVSAPNGSVGSLGLGVVYVFHRDEQGRWSLLQKLEPDADDPGEWFGWSLAFSEGTLLVGAPNENATGPQSGAVYVFTLQDGVPTPIAHTPTSTGFDPKPFAAGGRGGVPPEGADAGNMQGPDRRIPFHPRDADTDAGAADAGSKRAKHDDGCSASGAGDRPSSATLAIAIACIGLARRRRPARRSAPRPMV